MRFCLNHKNNSVPFRVMVFFVILAFSASLIIPPQKAYGQSAPASAAGVFSLPVPGVMITPTPAYIPPAIKGIKIFPDNPLRFDFIIDTGHSTLKEDELKAESAKLIKYFLAALTVPEEELWVNLSPYEKDRIIPPAFGLTEMGRDLLAQDYILKQLTASLIYPDDELGSEFWKKIYQKAYELYGTREISVNTFNKVWVVPQKATVYASGDIAFIVDSHLKVMLEGDYLALKENLSNKEMGTDQLANEDVKKLNDLSSSIVREVILPAIEKEVNEGENFTVLRQIYHSMILATWFKRNLRESLLGQVYVEQNKISGVDVEDKTVKEKIYQQYLEAFKVGVYNYIKEDYDPVTQEIVPRKYFSGGFRLAGSIDAAMTVQDMGNTALLSGAADARDGEFITVSTVLDPVKNLDRLRRLLIGRITDEKFTLPEKANEGEILDALLNELISQGFAWEDESKSNELAKVIVISESQKETPLGKAIIKWVMNRQDGVKAINFKGKDDVWKIVAFESDIAAQLDLEREEVRQRQQGKHWIEAFNIARQTLSLQGQIDPSQAQEFGVAGRDVLSASTDKKEKGIDTKLNMWQDVVYPDPSLAPTPRAEFDDKNRYITFRSENTDKSSEEILAELDALVQREHYRMYRTNGFVQRQDHKEAETVYRIFDKLVVAYNKQAAILGEKSFEGKLFIVDDPTVNAFVFAEHSDVYIYTGIIREMAHFAELTGLDFGEDLIEGVLAHEMTHVLQHSTFVGIRWEDLKGKNVLVSEAMEMKRKAEFNADEGAMILLSFAGYNPEAMLGVLEFLQKMEKRGTTEAALDSHPHPKERVANLETLVEDEVKVFPNWGRNYSKLDIGPYKNFKGRHLGNKATDIHSLQDVKRMIENAKTIEEVIELVRIAKYIENRLSYMPLIKSKKARGAFAQYLIMNGIIDVMQEVVHRATSGQKIYPDSLRPFGSEGLLVKRLTSEEELNDSAIDPSARNSDININNLETERLLTDFHKNALQLMDSVTNANISAEQKLKLLVLLRNIEERGKQEIESLSELDGLYQDFVLSDPSNQKGYEDIVTRILKGDLEALSELENHPFAFYKVYGKQSLDDVVESSKYLAPIMGEEFDDIDMGRAFIERESFYFYEKNLRLHEVSSREARDKVFEAALISFIINRTSFSSDVSNMIRKNGDLDKINLFRKFKADGLEQAIYQAVLRTAPAVEVSESFTVKIREGDKDQLKKVTSSQAREFFAEYLSGQLKSNNDEKKKGSQAYARAAIGSEVKNIFSSIFEEELDGEVVSAVKVMTESSVEEMTEDEAKWYELHGKSKEVAEYIALKANDENEDAQVEIIIKILNNFTSVFRREIVSKLMLMQQLPYGGQKGKGSSTVTLTNRQWQHILQKTVHPADAFELLYNKIVDDYKPADRSRTAESVFDRSDDRVLEELEVVEWVIAQKPANVNRLSQEFLDVYLSLQLKKVYIDVIKSLSAEGKSSTDSEVNKLAEEKLTPEFVFSILDRISMLGYLTYATVEEMTSAEDDDIAIGKLNKETYEQIISQTKKDKKVSPENVPVAFFYGPKAKIQQMFFRKMFDLSVDQLGQLARNQLALREKEALEKGRIKKLPDQTNVHELIDLLIFNKILTEKGKERKNVSYSDLSEVFDASLYLSRKYKSVFGADGKRETKWIPVVIVTVSIKLSFSLDGYKFKDQFNLNNLTKLDGAKVFFERLGNSGFMGKYSKVDRFFEQIFDTKVGFKLFPIFNVLMSDVQLPELKRQEMRESEERRSYLEATAQSIELGGTKAKLFKKFDREELKLKDSNDSLDDRLQKLEFYFPKANLFRDGYFDAWERSLVPEMSPNWMEQKGLSIIRKKQEKNRQDYFDDFDLLTIMTPLQWQKVKNEKLEMNEDRARNVLGFYRKVIPLVFDPQRQLRMGATAIKIFRNAFPAATFHEELEALKAFFPFASSLRDQEIQKLLDNHIVPSLDDGVSDQDIGEVMLLQKSYQDLRYDEELTNANFIENMIKAILASSSREDRIEILFWILNPKDNEKPKIIKELDDKLNIEFEELPYHMNFLPEEYRVRILQGIFLGENGIFSPQSEGDYKVMNQFTDRLFGHFFPPRDQIKRNRKRQLDPPIYNLVRALFPVVMQEYSPARRTAITMSLLRLTDKIDEFSEGQRLAILLDAIGPVGSKIAQWLSENQTVIPNEYLRSDLASAKSNAAPISKLAILETLRLEGFDFNKIEIGRRLGSASMKQVHEGRMQMENGEWVEVVIKVLRPKIERSITTDIKVLKKVIEFLKKERGIDGGDIAETIERWIQIESDFRIEAKNVEVVNEALADFYRELNHQDMGRRIKTPRVIVGNRVAVMIEEKVKGVEVGRLFSTERDRKVVEETLAERRLTKAKLMARGFTDEEAAEVLAVDRKDIVLRLRDMLMFMIFRKGKFHADLHSDNTMVGPKEDYVIDMGLVKKINDQQIQGANNIIRGILLHDTDILFEGIKQMHLHSSDLTDNPVKFEKDIDARKRKIVQDIRKIFRNRQNIKSEINDISSRILQERFGIVSDDFAGFMKALTQAIWLFPTDIFNALGTLKAVSRQLNLSPREYRKTLRKHGWPVLKHALGFYLFELKEDWKVRISLKIDPIRDWWKRRKRDWGNVKMLSEASKNIGVLADHLDALVESHQERYETVMPASEIIVGASLSEDTHVYSTPIKDFDVDLKFEHLSKVAGYQNLDDQQKASFKYTVKLYFQVLSLLESRHIDFNGIASKEMELLTTLGARQYGDKTMMVDEIIARVLTMRIFKERLERKRAQMPFVDFISPQDPILRTYGEIWTDIFLRQQKQREAMRDIDFFDKKTEHGKNSFYEKLVAEDDELLSKGGLINSRNFNLPVDSSGRDLKVSYQRTEGGSIPNQYLDSDLRADLWVNRAKMRPKIYYETVIGGVAIRATRTGYSDRGRFLIDFINFERSEIIHLVLSEEQFKSFAKGNSVKVHSTESWSGSPLAQGSFGKSYDSLRVINQVKFSNGFRKTDVDRAALSTQASNEDSVVGGIDLNPNMLELNNEGDGLNFNMPFDPQTIQSIPIDGFAPVILQIVPTNLPLLMGVDTKNEIMNLSQASVKEKI